MSTITARMRRPEKKRQRLIDDCPEEVEEAAEDNIIWRHPNDSSEIANEYEHYSKHMKLDFHYYNQMSFSAEYLELLLEEWCLVAKIRTSNHYSAKCSGGFISLEDYRSISKRMQEQHSIESWKINDEELKHLKLEFSGEGCMSLRRFCLYVEREEFYDNQENALRLTHAQDY